MLNCPDLDPAIANAAYMEFRASAAWLFDDTSPELSSRGVEALVNGADSVLAVLEPKNDAAA